MRYVKTVLFVVILFLTSVNEAAATKWVQLEPEKVIERADVIVMGTYDISAAPNQDDIFAGFPFNIERVYKGEVKTPVIAGMDAYDIGIVKEVQGSGGKYLLFLEEGEVDFLVPVAGQNGMVELKNNKVVEYEGMDGAQLYEEILKKEYKEAENRTIKDDFTAYNWWLIAFFAGAVFLFLRYLKRRA
ncbi:hypothetical protein ACFQPF_17735 [Fictibacillus iocasae]|uniref:Uncharacterized protein n=1 Tax=Fictibacillus iocasae TaxID=2715437 RepID=A0ABW2NXY4_9BACL